MLHKSLPHMLGHRKPHAPRELRDHCTPRTLRKSRSTCATATSARSNLAPGELDNIRERRSTFDAHEYATRWGPVADLGEVLHNHTRCLSIRRDTVLKHVFQVHLDLRDARRETPHARGKSKSSRHRRWEFNFLCCKADHCRSHCWQVGPASCKARQIVDNASPKTEGSHAMVCPWMRHSRLLHDERVQHKCSIGARSGTRQG